VLAVAALEREVNNGGYDQFFTNSSEEFASVIVDRLNRIGCNETASITHDAISALGVSTLDSPSIATALAENGNAQEKLSVCDRAFHKTGELPNNSWRSLNSTEVSLDSDTAKK